MIKKSFFLPLCFAIWMLIGCSPQPQSIMTASLTPKNKATLSPSDTPSPLPDTLTPAPSPSSTWTPKPTFTPTQTHTPVPSLTAMIILLDPNEPQCLRREDLQETKIATVLDGTLFCIEWIDLFDNETGFRIILKYDNTLGENGSGEIFIYEVGPNSTQLIVPDEHAPRLGESQDQCQNRSSFTVQVIVLGPNDSLLGSEQMATEIGCNAFALPTSTATVTPTP